MESTLIVAVDGSPDSQRAVEWCAKYAPKLGANVVAVHTLEVHVYPAAGAFGPTMLGPLLSDEDRAKIRNAMERDWCAPLSDAGVSFEVALVDGAPSTVIQQTAEKHHADMVVAGRRGHGGFAELVLGSTTHHLTHHLKVPLVIVP